MKVAVVPAPGLGDAIILQIVSHHLQKMGHEVTTFTHHNFGRWFCDFTFATGDDFTGYDAIYLQHDNRQRSKKIKEGSIPVYTFYGAYREDKHGKLDPKLDFVSDLSKCMVDNVVASLKPLFGIDANKDNGLKVPSELTFRKYPKRVAIHTTSGDPTRNWPLEKFQKVATFLENEGYEPHFLPAFHNLDQLLSFLYESSFFIGNDSGPGHIASCLNLPNLIIGREAKHMLHWRPG